MINATLSESSLPPTYPDNGLGRDRRRSSSLVDLKRGDFTLQGTFDHAWGHFGLSPGERAAAGLECVEARKAAKLPTVHRKAPTEKTHQHQKSTAPLGTDSALVSLCLKTVLGRNHAGSPPASLGPSSLRGSSLLRLHYTDWERGLCSALVTGERTSFYFTVSLIFICLITAA